MSNIVSASPSFVCVFFHSFLRFSLKFMNIQFNIFKSDHKVKGLCLSIAIVPMLVL